jgi:putative NIF3 family GTP cyclohydrolase 1 type 2
MSDPVLVVRLLQSAEYELAAHGGFDNHCRAINEAAATIERLTKEREEAIQRGVVLAIKSEKNEHRADSLAAELAKAREALTQIIEGRGTFSHDRFEHACNTIKDMKTIARAALPATPEPQPCQTCHGTGNEARHSICRDCDGAGKPQP